MAKRKNLSKSVRFEVFKRDSFTCQYCGKSAPDVVLEVDHIIPVSKGGDNDISNLITACFDCNRGKSDRKLNDNQTLKLQKEELDKLNKRREQLELMAQWRMELLNLHNEEANKIIEIINAEIGTNFSLTKTGIEKMKSYIEKYGFNEVLECSLISFKQYDSEVAFNKIVPIIKNRARQKDDPNIKEIYYIRGIARNRFSYFDDKRGFLIIKKLYDMGVDLEEIKEITLNAENWTQWNRELNEYLN